MKRLFQVDRAIDAPATSVWSVMIDVARWPEWTPTVTEVRHLGHPAFGVGSRVQIRQPRLPRAVWQVTRLEEGRAFTWESTGPGIRSIGHHEVTPTEAGCAVRLSIEQAGPMGAVAALAWKRLIQRYVETEAACLESRVRQLHPR